MRKARFQIVFSLCAAAAMWIVGTLAASAQNQPAGPYKPVAITPPAPVSDPAFEAMRQQLGEVAQRKDRAALSALVVAKGFFWERENGDRADKRKSGADNLAVALGLNNKGGVGWEILFSFTDDPTASASPEHKGAICSPAEPGYDAKAFDELLKATQSDESEWSYPVAAGTEEGLMPSLMAVKPCGVVYFSPLLNALMRGIVLRWPCSGRAAARACRRPPIFRRTAPRCSAAPAKASASWPTMPTKPPPPRSTVMSTVASDGAIIRAAVARPTIR